MSADKKKYVSPKYDMIKFDSQIMTGYSTGCWGVVGLVYDAQGELTGECHTTHEGGENIWPINDEYND